MAFDFNAWLNSFFTMGQTPAPITAQPPPATPQDATEVTDSVGGYYPSQPSQKYPFTPVSPPRVDNKNQPWYGGTQWWGKGADTVQSADDPQMDVLTTNPQTGMANYNLSDTWAQMDKWYGGQSDKSNLMDTSDVEGSDDGPGTSPVPEMGRHNQDGWDIRNNWRDSGDDHDD